MRYRTSNSILLLLALLLGWPELAAAQTSPRREPRSLLGRSAQAPAGVLEEKSGVFPARQGGLLRLTTDVGNIRVLSGESDQVRYQVRVETDSRVPHARNLLGQFEFVARSVFDGVVITGNLPRRAAQGPLFVSFEVSVPQDYHLDLSTQAGSIEVQDIKGRVSAVTAGGNITLGNAGGPTRLETQGGHITVQDVGGELTATTAGGHIRAGVVKGNAVVRTGGGHIRVVSVGGTARLETTGGNITVERASSHVTATTGGGRIDFGEAAGAVWARTGGGGIRVLQVLGPTELEATVGSIQLLKVLGPVRASTSSGNITAWFSKDLKVQGPSQLICDQGDIVVYLPKQLAITIDATIEMAGDHRVEAHPDLPLTVRYLTSRLGGQTLRAEGALNGGGQVLRLKTVAGNIKLQVADPFGEIIRKRLEYEQGRIEQQLKLQEKALELQLKHQERALEEQLKHKEKELGLFAELQLKLAERLWGRVRVDPEEQSRRLIQKVDPVYPEAARKARVQGLVRLEVLIGRGGTAQNVKVLSGHSWLAQAAEQAVRQWRWQPFILDDRPVPVLTTVSWEFRLD